MTDDLQLPQRIESYLAALAQLYGQEGKRTHEAIVVNAKPRVDPNWRRDWINESFYGEALYLSVPSALFITKSSERNAIQDEICAELNLLHGTKQEWFDKVFIELSLDPANDWRKKSGLLIGTTRAVDDRATKRIWGKGGFRIFLSHKTEVRLETAKLKEDLSSFGVSSFVAHSDINPTREWQEEIENALASMDAFIALLTEDFHKSLWTDQEVGYAVARGVPIIAVKLGADPYGFIGKFQALPSTWETAPVEIVKLLINSDRMLSAYTSAVANCTSFEMGNNLATILPSIQNLNQRQIADLVGAYNASAQAQGAFGLNGRKEIVFGPGLVHYLNKFENAWEFDSRGVIAETIPF